MYAKISIYFSGYVDTDPDFSYTSGMPTVQGCAVTLQDQMWYFGGYLSQYKRQVILFRNNYFKTY